MIPSAVLACRSIQYFFTNQFTPTLHIHTRQMLGCPASDAELIEWSKELGSDITFFLSKGTAYCTGRGEILKPLPALAASNSIYIVKVLKFVLNRSRPCRKGHRQSRPGRSDGH